MKTCAVAAITWKQLLFGFIQICFSDVALWWRVNEVLQRQSTFIQEGPITLILKFPQWLIRVEFQYLLSKLKKNYKVLE